jgi:hypothetical protein
MPEQLRLGGFGSWSKSGPIRDHRFRLVRDAEASAFQGLRRVKQERESGASRAIFGGTVHSVVHYDRGRLAADTRRVDRQSQG